MKSVSAVVFLACASIWLAFSDPGFAEGQQKSAKHEPNGGYVSDAAAAKDIGKAVLSHLLTPDGFRRKEFSDAVLKDGVWTVRYWEVATDINVPVVIQIRQRSGAIIKYEDPNV